MTARAFNRRILACTSLVALAFGGAPAFAQTDADKDRDVVVVTGTTTPTQYEKIGSSLTVISGSLIQDEGYTYVPDVLRQVPGVAVNQGGSPGSLTQVRIRGGEGNHTLTLLDGFDISSPDTGETDFSTLMSGDIQRIEVLRGPQSGLYGSNALAGVINLITRRDVNGSYVNAMAEAGELGTAHLQLNGGAGNGQSYLSAGLDGLSTQGYDVSPDTSSVGVTSVGQGSSAGDKEGNSIGTVYLRGGMRVSPEFRIDAIARYVTKDTDQDGQAFNFPISGRTYDDASKADDRQSFIGATGTLDLLDGKWQTVFSASYLDEERRGRGTSFPFFAGPTLPANAAATLAAVTLDPNGADALRTKFTLQSTYEFGSADFLSHITGFVEHKEEKYQNPYPATPTQAPEQSRDLTGFGVQYRADIAQQLYLSATLRHDDNGDFEDDNTYSVAASWVVPNTGTRPHASVGTGVTNPTFFEQFGFDPGTFVGNPNLVPEKAAGWDIGVEQSFLNGRALVDVTYFESTLKKEIFTSFGPAPLFLSTPANSTSDSDRSGWEVTGRFYPTDDIDLVTSYTNLDATEPAGVEVRRPKNQASLDAGWRIGGGPLKLDLGVTYNGEQFDTDFATFSRAKMDAYTLVRVGASYALNDTVEVFGRVENVTDEDYQEVIGFKGEPRAAYIGIRFKGGTAK